MSESAKLKSQLVIVTGLTVLYFIFSSVYFVYAAALAGVVFLAIPPLGNLILKLWFKLADILGWINSRVLLSLVFYIFLFPIAVLSRISSNDLLKLKRTSPGLFSDRNHKYKKEDLEKTW